MEMRRSFQAKEWLEAGWTDPKKAFKWHKEGWHPFEALEWYEEGWDDPEEAKKWRNLYFSPLEARRFKNSLRYDIFSYHALNLLYNSPHLLKNVYVVAEIVDDIYYLSNLKELLDELSIHYLFNLKDRLDELSIYYLSNLKELFDELPAHKNHYNKLIEELLKEYEKKLQIDKEYEKACKAHEKNENLKMSFDEAFREIWKIRKEAYYCDEKADEVYSYITVIDEEAPFLLYDIFSFVSLIAEYIPCLKELPYALNILISFKRHHGKDAYLKLLEKIGEKEAKITWGEAGWDIED